MINCRSLWLVAWRLRPLSIGHIDARQNVAHLLGPHPRPQNLERYPIDCPLSSNILPASTSMV